MSPHRIGWIDEEMCELLCDGKSVGIIGIYEFEPCPACGTMLKLRQVHEILEQPLVVRAAQEETR